MKGEGKSMLGTWLVDESRIRVAAERERKENITKTGEMRERGAVLLPVPGLST